MAGWVPRNLREPPGISGLDVGRQGQQIEHQAPGSPGSSMGAPGTQMVHRDHVCHPKDQPATEGSWCEVKDHCQDCGAGFQGVGVFAHFPEISLPLLANSSQPGFGQPGVVGAVV